MTTPSEWDAPAAPTAAQTPPESEPKSPPSEKPADKPSEQPPTTPPATPPATPPDAPAPSEPVGEPPAKDEPSTKDGDETKPTKKKEPGEAEKTGKKKKGAAERIAEQKAAKEAANSVPKPRDPSIAWIEFTQPLGWPVSEPTGENEKLLYSFKLTDPKSKKDKAILMVSFMPNRAGRTDALLKTWIGHYVLKGGGKPEFADVSHKTEINGLPVTIVELRGALKSPKSGELTIGQKLIAVVIRHPKGPFVIRCQGPASLIDAQHDAIMKFIESVRPATPSKPDESKDAEGAEKPDHDPSSDATTRDAKTQDAKPSDGGAKPSDHGANPPDSGATPPGGDNKSKEKDAQPRIGDADAKDGDGNRNYP